jgi:deoxyribodipyrimidine photo-lyase
VAKLLQSHQVNWVQFQRDGIVRGIKDRNNWDKMWYTVMSEPCIKNTYTTQHFTATNPFVVPPHLHTLWSEVNPLFQPAGESFAYQYLQSFLAKRGANYSYHISKPALSRLSCSRLSPYLAWGNISIKQVYQITSLHLRTSSSKKAFLNFLSRTKWHCHFIQKFEQDCTYETHYLNKGYEALQLSNNIHYLEAWKQGKTGVPLVDACMRCLHQTGWINFRMRALLVSFLTHHLDIDFRLGAHHLAQLFLDYEPGIHYPQLQMHAGTTGVNLLRVYNPVKNALQHDADAVFTKKWVPELAHLPVPLVHHPWLMTPMDNLLYNFELGKHYPAPIVNVEGGAKANVQKIWDLRHTETTQHEMRRIIKSHTRPKKADAKRSKK